MHNFNLTNTLLIIGTVMAGFLVAAGFLIFLERRVAASVQDRFGPNRVGPGGLLQPLADALKFLFKEDIIPRQADKLLYVLAPTIALSTALLAFAVVPFGSTSPAPKRPQPPAELAKYEESVKNFRGELAQKVVGPAWQLGSVLASPTLPQLYGLAADLPKLAADLPRQPQKPRAVATYDAQRVRYEREARHYRQSHQFVIAPNLDIGIVFVFAVTSLAVYGIILGGWSSNNKYSLLGALRSSAQLVSYEIPLGLSIVGVVLLTGSLNLERIIHHQAQSGVWNFFVQPLACLIFISSAFAECNRLPFDLPEAEQELIGGYHTEYSALKFAMFFLGEYTHMITTSFLMVILFFGGWHFPWLAEPDSRWFLKFLAIALKMGFFILFYMIVRWTIPRFRFDQLMALAWKVMIPLALGNLLCVMVVQEVGWSAWLLLPASVVLFVGSAWLSTLRASRRPSPSTV